MLGEDQHYNKRRSWMDNRNMLTFLLTLGMKRYLPFIPFSFSRI